ncbi:UDP-2,4-diacetamido-2,4,6-trideoxy-beta-L-altropyranose hydrolase [Sulfurimonas sp.]|uniref:UDP-2,4-diacetamido-2,4, 6-trideoxy-beta-L-altropyranose hydrolase n=1 Tax=Sulfurimonas sp. TaxID=2022749 RepID=UPI0025ED94DD|nr:UDP-2,4-diacetamido-2,4,6-trideoxy-beta-L-altropyranose hydrolase [Sulfurimonas sp.]
MTNILLRADSSSKIGLGHIMRDLVLVKEFKKANISFACKNLKGNINHKVLEAGYNLEILKSNSKEELLKLIKKLKIDMLIIDHYKIDYKIQMYIKEKTGVKIFVVDDTYEKHQCDILLNPNLGADLKRYKNLVPKNCELRCGSKYTLLRDEFAKEKKRKKAPKKKTIFLAMGGSDVGNISLRVLKTLKAFKNVEVHIVTTSSNKNISSLKNYVKKRDGLHLHIDASNIAKLMAKSSFAIVSPSVILNEVYFMNLAFIAIKTAKNQHDIYKYLKNQNFLTLKKFNEKVLFKNCQQLLGSKYENQ